MSGQIDKTNQLAVFSLNETFGILMFTLVTYTLFPVSLVHLWQYHDEHTTTSAFFLLKIITDTDFIDFTWLHTVAVTHAIVRGIQPS